MAGMSDRTLAVLALALDEVCLLAGEGHRERFDSWLRHWSKHYDPDAPHECDAPGGACPACLFEEARDNAAPLLRHALAAAESLEHVQGRGEAECARLRRQRDAHAAVTQAARALLGGSRVMECSLGETVIRVRHDDYHALVGAVEAAKKEER